MSWIYTLVVTGMFIAGGSDALTLPDTAADTATDTSCTIARTAAAQDETVKFEQTYPITPNGKVSISNINGSIELVAWDRNEVKLEATKIASTKEALDLVEIDVDARPDSIRIETDYKKVDWQDHNFGKGMRVEVQYRLSVPRTAQINEAGTVNGSVKAAGFVNSTKISAVNGDVNVGNLRGTANLSTVNGTVAADFERLEPGSRIHVSTVNGRVDLTLPSDSNATLKAESVHGPISNAFGLPVRKGEFIGRNLHGRLGDGSVNISLSSVNGPMAINKRDDGKAVSPAVNLLTGKEGEDSWDDSGMAPPDVKKFNREIQRSVREAERVSRAASVDAAKSLANVQLKELEEMEVELNKAAIDMSIANSVKMKTIVLDRMHDNLWLGPSRLEKKSNSFTVKGVPTVKVDATSANVTVRGWDKPEVRYAFTELNQGPRRAETVVGESQNGSEITLSLSSVTRSWGRTGGDAPRIEIYVPRKTNLIIETEGEVRVEGITGSLEIKGEENSVDVRESDGKLKVTNSDGTVRVIGFKGDLIAETTDGEVYLDGEFTAIDATSTNGRFVVTLPDNADAKIETSGEAIGLENFRNARKLNDTSWQLGNGSRAYKFSSVDGAVEVRNRETVRDTR